MELTILLDESGELANQNNFNKMKSFIKNLAREFQVSNKKTRIGLISFTDANLQLFDLHSYHDRKSIDSEIDKLNYEGKKTESGALNKALDATQANLFTGERDQSVPRLLFVFDSTTMTDEQTEIKGIVNHIFISSLNQEPFLLISCLKYSYSTIVVLKWSSLLIL